MDVVALENFLYHNFDYSLSIKRLLNYSNISFQICQSVVNLKSIGAIYKFEFQKCANYTF